MNKLFCPSSYIALPDCLVQKTVQVGPGLSVPLDKQKIDSDTIVLTRYFKSLPKYESWVDFLPFHNGNEVLARMAAFIGEEVGAWSLEGQPGTYEYPRLKHKRRIPKPSAGDIVEEPTLE